MALISIKYCGAWNAPYPAESEGGAGALGGAGEYFVGLAGLFEDKTVGRHVVEVEAFVDECAALVQMGTDKNAYLL